MIVTIDTTKSNIDWYAKGTERIVQNILNLVKTFRYEVAFDRLMGLDPDMRDLPIDQLTDKIPNEIIELISIYEPRAEVKKVEVLGIDLDGNIQLKVTVDIS